MSVGRGFSGWIGVAACVLGAEAWVKLRSRSGIGREVGLDRPSGTFILATVATKLYKRGRLPGSACVSFCCSYLFGIFSGTLERDFVYIYLFTLCVGLQL